jgi:hypothetical protein
MKSQIKITEARRLLHFLSEPYVMYTRLGFQPVIDAEDVHSGEQGYLIISAVSLGEPLHKVLTGNGGLLSGKTVSVRKESADRMARYVVVESTVTDD